MKPLGNPAIPLLPGRGQRTLTPEEQEAVEEVLDAADYGLADAATTGALCWAGQPSPAYTRFVALAVTPTSDPRRAALETLRDKLISQSGFIRTEQGIFSAEDLGTYDVALHWRRTSDQPDPWRHRP